jgi:hypothetical protein
MFAAGTTFRACEIDTACPNNATPQTTSVAIQRIILSVAMRKSPQVAIKKSPLVAK